MVGRRSKSDDVTGGVHRQGGVLGREESGIFVADADAVEIRARSAAGVTIVADGPSTEEAAGGAGDRARSGGSRTGGGRLEVSMLSTQTILRVCTINAVRSVGDNP